MEYAELRQTAAEANLALRAHGLVTLTGATPALRIAPRG